jgi:hypothetical protein
MEEWKVAVENYEVSSFGNVRRKLLNGKTRNLKCSLLNRGKGYKYFQLTRDGKRHNYLVHHLVAKMFIGEREEGLVIDHVDRNSLNNHMNNLRYVSQLENSQNREDFREDIPRDTPNRRAVLIKTLLLENRDKYNQNRKVVLRTRPKGGKT